MDPALERERAEQAVREAWDAVTTVHEGYVQTVSLFGRLGGGLWDLIKVPIQAGVNLATRVIGAGLEYGADKVCRAYNHVNGHRRGPLSKRRLESVREQLKVVNLNLGKLSKLCSTVFDRSLIFSGTPTQRQLASLKTKLEAKGAEFGLLTDSALVNAQDEAVKICDELIPIMADLEAKFEEELTVEDIKALGSSLYGNIFVQAAVDGTVENVGEALGGMLVEEGSMFVCDSLNPAVGAGRLLQRHVGQPVGKLMGTGLSFAATKALLDRISLGQHEDKRKLITLLSLVGVGALTYFGLNPVVLLMDSLVGGQLYNLGFYSMTLLFSYVGMQAVGTEETLPDYVRKMTPATLAYMGSEVFFDAVGYGGFETLILATFVSHVAFNHEMYSSLFRGTVLKDNIDVKDLTINASRAQTKLIRDLFVGHLQRGLRENTLKALEAPVVRTLGDLTERYVPLPVVSLDRALSLAEKALPKGALPALRSREMQILSSFIVDPQAQRGIAVLRNILEIVAAPITKCKVNLDWLKAGGRGLGEMVAEKGLRAILRELSDEEIILDGFINTEVLQKVEELFLQSKENVSQVDLKYFVKELTAFISFLNTGQMRRDLRMVANSFLEMSKKSKLDDPEAQEAKKGKYRQQVREFFISQIIGDYVPADAVSIVSHRLLKEIDQLFELNQELTHLISENLEAVYPLVDLDEAEGQATSEALDLFAKAFVIKLALRLIHLESESQSLDSEPDILDMKLLIREARKFIFEFVRIINRTDGVAPAEEILHSFLEYEITQSLPRESASDVSSDLDISDQQLTDSQYDGNIVAEEVNGLDFEFEVDNEIFEDALEELLDDDVFEDAIEELPGDDLVEDDLFEDGIDELPSEEEVRFYGDEPDSAYVSREASPEKEITMSSVEPKYTQDAEDVFYDFEEDFELDAAHGYVDQNEGQALELEG